MKGAARARRRWMGDVRCFSPTGLRQRVLEPQGKLTLMKIRGVRVLPASGFRHRYQDGLGGPLATPPTCGDAFGRLRVSAAC